MNKISKLYACTNKLLSSIERLLPIEQPVNRLENCNCSSLAQTWRCRIHSKW